MVDVKLVRVLLGCGFLGPKLGSGPKPWSRNAKFQTLSLNPNHPGPESQADDVDEFQHMNYICMNPKLAEERSNTVGLNGKSAGKDNGQCNGN